jgi:hypothetical protein
VRRVVSLDAYRNSWQAVRESARDSRNNRLR